jgi:dCTP deaminase
VTVLVDWEIEDLIDQGLTDPKWKPLINPASMDLTLADDALLLVPHGYWSSDDVLDGVDNRFGQIKLSNYQFRAGDRVLLSVEQTLNLPPTVTGQIYLKSSRGREFYEHLLAGWVDPGYQGNLTLELINHSYNTLPLAKGDRVVQIVFMRCNAPRVPYGQGVGKYQGDVTVSCSKECQQNHDDAPPTA